MAIRGDWNEPADEFDPSDWQASDRAMQFSTGWFANPVFLGDYPQVMKDLVKDKSTAAGLGHSMLPEFTPEESANITGTLFKKSIKK